MSDYTHNLRRLRRRRPIEELRAELDRLVAGVDRAALVAEDPVALVHAYDDPHDQEVAGLLVAGLAYGRVGVIREKAAEALAALGPSPARAVDRGEAARALAGFAYRFQRGDDVARFLDRIGRTREIHGSLAAAFAASWRAEDDDLAATAARFVARFRAGVEGPLTYGLRYLLPDPGTGGAAKRLLLYLRWMIRGPDGLDLGAWRVLAPELTPAGLVIPLDTHISRIARYLGLTRRAADDLRTAREITAALARLAPEDPVRYDMALCHLGISGACPRQLDLTKCSVCPIRQVCRVRPVKVRRAASRGG